MILVPLPHIVWGVRRLYALWGLSTLPARSIEQTLDQFRPILLDFDADLTREGLRHLYALGVEPLHIVNDISQCSVSVRRFSANAVILVPPPGSVDAYHPVLAVRTLIGPDLGLVVLVRDSDVSQEEDLVAGGADTVLFCGEGTHERARLAALTRRLRESVITLLDVSLDSRARQAFFEGRPLPLTDRLFWVLEFLVKHPARVVTPEDFAAMLVAKGIHIKAFSIPGLIHRLRRVLEEYGASDRIYAVHGRGYRWEELDVFLPQ